MRDGVVAEWYLQEASNEAEAELRRGMERSRMGWPQLLHRHAHGEPCGETCVTVDDPAAVGDDVHIGHGP